MTKKNMCIDFTSMTLADAEKEMTATLNAAYEEALKNEEFVKELEEYKEIRESLMPLYKYVSQKLKEEECKSNIIIEDGKTYYRIAGGTKSYLRKIKSNIAFYLSARKPSVTAYIH